MVSISHVATDSTFTYYGGGYLPFDLEVAEDPLACATQQWALKKATSCPAYTMQQNMLSDAMAVYQRADFFKQVQISGEEFTFALADILSSVVETSTQVQVKYTGLTCSINCRNASGQNPPLDPNNIMGVRNITNAAGDMLGQTAPMVVSTNIGVYNVPVTPEIAMAYNGTSLLISDAGCNVDFSFASVIVLIDVINSQMSVNVNASTTAAPMDANLTAVLLGNFMTLTAAQLGRRTRCGMRPAMPCMPSSLASSMISRTSPLNGSEFNIHSIQPVTYIFGSTVWTLLGAIWTFLVDLMAVVIGCLYARERYRLGGDLTDFLVVVTCADPKHVDIPPNGCHAMDWSLEMMNNRYLQLGEVRPEHVALTSWEKPKLRPVPYGAVHRQIAEERRR
ncbi:hypothetical protein YB2330_000596 [Saitoella coloradoensis]